MSDFSAFAADAGRHPRPIPARDRNPMSLSSVSVVGNALRLRRIALD
jgi:hypothetical protein